MIRLPLIAAGLAMALAPAPALADPGPVQQRIDKQQQRIDQGVASGALRPGEAAHDEAHIQQDEAMRNRDLAAHGGHLTSAERSRLHAKLDHNSHRIYDSKHNGKIAAPGR